MKRGFTLIELLVVLAVTAILSTGLTITINPLEQIKKGRDAQRKNDFSLTQRALELYYQDYRTYPPSICDKIDGKEWGTSWSPYMNPLPKDPVSNQTYVYQSDRTSYKLYARLENCSDPQIISPNNCDTYNYLVSPNQTPSPFTPSPPCIPEPTSTPPPLPTSTPTPEPTPSSAWVLCPDERHLGQARPVSGVTCNSVCSSFGFAGCVYRARQNDFNTCVPASPLQSGTCSDVFPVDPSFSSQCKCQPAVSGCADGSTDQDFGTTNGKRVHGCNPASVVTYANAGTLCAAGWHVGDIVLDPGVKEILQATASNYGEARYIRMNGDPGNALGNETFPPGSATGDSRACFGTRSPCTRGSSPNNAPFHAHEVGAVRQLYYNGNSILSNYGWIIRRDGGGQSPGAICVEGIVDADGDGYRSIAAGGTDCDDNCATCYPLSTHTTLSPDGKDQDCDGTVDEQDTVPAQKGCGTTDNFGDLRVSIAALQTACNTYCGGGSTMTCSAGASITCRAVNVEQHGIAACYGEYNFATCAHSGPRNVESGDGCKSVYDSDQGRADGFFTCNCNRYR